jgi:hypothetical protein
MNIKHPSRQRKMEGLRLQSSKKEQILQTLET